MKGAENIAVISQLAVIIWLPHLYHPGQPYGKEYELELSSMAERLQHQEIALDMEMQDDRETDRANAPQGSAAVLGN
ncbi:hypothetical protein Aduo_011665 [Ancylostoma duodenale]